MSGTIDGSSRSLAKNAISQIGGRLFLSLGRLVAALMIVHVAGPDRFGEYALVLQFIVLFEWLADFGQTDIGVRDICQRPADEPVLLGALATLKLVQGGILALLLPLLLLAMQYPASIVRAGAVGGVSVVCYALVQVFRAVFRVRMCTERDIAAELGGLAIMLPLTWFACRSGAGIETLVACYSVARLVFLALVIVFSRDEGQRAPRVIGRRAAMGLLLQALPLGIAGLLVSMYDSLATIMLSKLTELQSVAQYAAATRFVFPVIIVVQALGSAFYPPLSAAWRKSPGEFRRLQQSALDLSMLVGAGLFSGVFAGAGFLMGLMGPSIATATPILRVMSVVVLARAVTTVMSPLIVVAGRQGKALWLTALSILLQAAMLLLLVPRYGILGAAIGYLLIELVVGVVPVSVIGQIVTGVRLRWAVSARLAACAMVAAGLCALLPLEGTIWSGIMGGLLYVGLALATGTVSIRQMRSVLTEVMTARRARMAISSGDSA